MKLSKRGLRYWLPYYLYQRLLPKEKPDPTKPVHIFLCIVDHFEPFNGGVDFKTALKRVLTWRKEYPKFADRHRDSEGRPLQHTWFYPPHLDHRLLPYLVELCQEGYGDIEMHLHHNLMDPFPDTSQTLRDKILKCIDDYGKYGIFVQPDGPPRFAFIHGDWSLDNSGGDHLCGVNDELTILRECGCYADFTFPCLNRCQPAMINQIYYAVDDPNKPKSYNKGTIVSKGSSEPSNGLMIIQGIIGLRIDKRKRFGVAIDYSDLNYNDPPTKERMDFWFEHAPTVLGEPNIKFVKLHTHGAPEIRWEGNFGKEAHRFFEYIEKKYNDQKSLFLHYVTAREMFNVIKSVERDDFTGRSEIYGYVKPYPYKKAENKNSGYE